ncbi:MAG: type II and III secretion system protein family protein [Aestuariivirga sp.]
MSKRRRAMTAGKLARAAAAAMLAISLALPVMLSVPVRPALASDMDYGQQQQESGNYVRIGLNKSAVIRLPANARDVLVGNPDIVDAVVRTKNTAYLFAKSVGQTNLFFFDEAGQQILALDLEVALDMMALQKMIKRSIPGGRITVDTIGNNVVLGGTASSAEDARTAEEIASGFVNGSGAGAKVINTIQLSGKDQVMLKVRIVEVQRDVLKQFGVNLQAIFNAGKVAFNLASINPFTAGIDGLLSPNQGYKAAYTSGGDSIGGVVRAMERDGVLRTLAEPALTAISGESAKFLAGGEFPVPVDVKDNATIYEYKPYGIGLAFTPVVLPGGRISMKISTEVSDITTSGSATGGDTILPPIIVRRAETTVEMSSGGSMMLAGLIKDSMRQQINGTPGLKKLPILGSLFRSRDFVENQTELVVIVTPYLVNEVNEKQLATPADGFNTATDRQTILWGRLNKVYGAAGKSPDGVYHGNVGYIVE